MGLCACADAVVEFGTCFGGLRLSFLANVHGLVKSSRARVLRGGERIYPASGADRDREPVGEPPPQFYVNPHRIVASSPQSPVPLFLP